MVRSNAPIVRRKPDDHVVHTRMRHRRLDLHPAQIALVPRRIGHCGPGALDVVFTTDQLVRLRHAGNDGGEGGDCTRDGGVVGPREDVRPWDNGSRVYRVRKEVERGQAKRGREELA